MLLVSNPGKDLRYLLGYLRMEIITAFVYSTAIYWLYEHHDLAFLARFDFIPIGFFGTILSLFLGFRNNNAYSRWWEARTIWGDLVNASRQFGLQALSLIESSAASTTENIAVAQRELIDRHIAFTHMLRMQLRQQINFHEVTKYLSLQEQEIIQEANNPAARLLLLQARRLQALMQNGLLTDFRLIALIQTQERFHNILGACERIKNTPFPREYDEFVRCLIWVQIAILPLYLLGLFKDNISQLLVIPITVALTVMIGFANKAGEMLEDPFENRIHDVPMTTLCNTIERDLLAQVGEHHLPEKAQAVQGIAW